MSDIGYDPEEALALMAEAAEALAPDAAGRELAAVQLLERVEGLSGEYGFHTKREAGGVWLILRGGDAIVGAAKVVHDGGEVAVQSRRGRSIPVPLRYNRRTAHLEGEGFDEFYVPIPGEPRRRRSGLAVVVETALRLIREDASSPHG